MIIPEQSSYIFGFVDHVCPPWIAFPLFLACIQDIRLNNGWFPMDFSENSDPDAVAELKENPNVEEGCVREDCLSNPCPSGRQCYPLWEDFECRFVHC